MKNNHDHRHRHLLTRRFTNNIYPLRAGKNNNYKEENIEQRRDEGNAKRTATI